ncbi:hypothetical protein M9H77_30157 [Catharanthus roseus]|uniref:Uncharacterized protein n=1 Tax=Catharanthus roseus TaxID=4058 RepID=A0ACB9ZYB6_CATRO|nr:hypothetical protein M9H77_30157 [Catharanthus roseus]
MGLVYLWLLEDGANSSRIEGKRSMGQRQGQAKVKFIESSTVEESPKNFEDSSKDEGGELAYKSINTIHIFPSNSYLSFEIYFKEIKLFSLKTITTPKERKDKKLLIYYKNRMMELDNNS